ncbi:MAG: class I SAM-dependent methyltransferase [Pseudorhizobium sp.]
MKTDPRSFILANTTLLAPPHVPEVRLHLADEAHDLWQKTEDELEEVGLPPPFWAFAWAGGQGLARYILDNPEAVSGRRVLDFATGSGLVAIAASLADALSVRGADIDPWAAEAVKLNATANGVAVEFTGADMIGTPVEAEVVLAGDVFYDQVFAQALLPWFRRLASEGRLVLVGDPGRSYLPKDALEPLASYEVPVTRALEDAEVKKTIVWRLI